MHGGDIYSNHIDLDFSVNLNPLGMPENVRKAIVQAADTAGHYPDPAYRELRDAIGRNYGVEPSRIVCGNGASELIAAVCRAFLKGNPEETGSFSGSEVSGSRTPKPKAVILAPGFTGYRYALSMVHADVISISLDAANDFIPDDRLEEVVAEEKPQLLILANPSNPSGVMLSKERMSGLARLCRTVGTVLCVDECFMELSGCFAENSMTAFCASAEERFPNLIVLNAVTKTYGIPGIRLGYAFCGSAAMAEILQHEIPEWNVSTIAEAAGMEAFRTDLSYLKNAEQRIRSEREYLTNELADFGFYVCPSRANYLLFHASDNLYDPLLKQRILIRDCSDYEGLGKGWYRVAVRQHEENARLISVIKGVL